MGGHYEPHYDHAQVRFFMCIKIIVWCYVLLAFAKKYSYTKQEQSWFKSNKMKQIKSKTVTV